MRYLFTSAIFTVLGISPALAASKPVPFVGIEYRNPQQNQPIFVHTWPNLIEQNNAQMDKFLGQPSIRGHNHRLEIITAVVPITNGTATITMPWGNVLGCMGQAIGSHDNYPHPMVCPARLTIKRKGEYRSLNLGKLCIVDSGQHNDIAYANFNSATNTINTYIIIDGKKVGDDGFGGNCNKTIELTN